MTDMQREYMDTRDHRPLAQIPTGSSVMKPDAQHFDWAYCRLGVVIRENHPELGTISGIRWEGQRAAFQYSDDTMFDLVAPDNVKPICGNRRSGSG